MAFDKRLISDMENESDGATEQAPETVVPENPVEAPVESVPETENAPVPQPESMPAPAPATEDYRPLFEAVQRQLAEVNRSLSRLEMGTPAKAKDPELAEIRQTLNQILAEVSKPAPVAPPAPKMPELEEMLTMMRAMAEKLDRNDRQLSQSLRENANFQIQVRQGMQKDLDKLRQQQLGEQFNPILKEIAAVYSEYQFLLAEELPDRVHKNIRALLEQLGDLLEDNDAEICVTEVGTVRPMRQCKIVQKIPTGKKEMHNTIALSRKPGVVRDRVILYPESVDVYVYDETLDIPEPQPEEVLPEEPQSVEAPVCEPVAEEAAPVAPETPVEIPETETVNPAGEDAPGI